VQPTLRLLPTPDQSRVGLLRAHRAHRRTPRFVAATHRIGGLVQNALHVPDETRAPVFEISGECQQPRKTDRFTILQAPLYADVETYFVGVVEGAADLFTPTIDRVVDELSADGGYAADLSSLVGDRKAGHDCRTTSNGRLDGAARQLVT
jgi:hypothetical protein